MVSLDELLALSKLGDYDGTAKAAQAFRELSIAEAHAIAKEYLDADRTDDRLFEEFLHRLAAFAPGSVDGLHQKLLDRGIYYPGILYRGASGSSRDVLIDMIGRGGVSADRILKALAWIGDDVVVRRLREWTEMSPAWRAKLHVSPDQYALEAGWTIKRDGIRHDLFPVTCVPLVMLNSDDTVIADTVINQPRKDSCPWCGLTLVDLFDLDLSSLRIEFLGLDGSRLRIGTCVRCSCYSVIYTVVDLHGESAWSADNKRPPFNGDDGGYVSTPAPAAFGPNRRSPFEAHPSLLFRGGSQLGGFPSWEQDAEFPKCPGCNDFMKFIGQVGGSDIMEYGEGYTYAFLCAGCGNAATVYQQT